MRAGILRNNTVLIVLLAMILGGVSLPAFAQNFANAGPAVDNTENVYDSDEDLTDDKVLRLLDAEAQQYIQQGGGNDVYIPEDSRYTLGVSDVISINVQRHPEVSGQFPINAEGKIQYGFVGDIYIQGKTKSEVKEILTEELSKYIIAPEVTVIITGYNSKIVYVFGEVGHPGKIFMRGDTITVREALVQSGLPLLSAKMKDGRVVTPSVEDKRRIQKVNVHKLLIEGDLKENYVMKPGDTLYVPPTFWAKLYRKIQPVATPIGTAAGTGRTLTTGF
ncbi:MAG: polysaccharide biosynthesis/export family protein [Candidatus Omnitrophica bacterium]|nr:polysaccharide biosynthesis/export family protein [Candidatus Omnitrophota bacterium]